MATSPRQKYAPLGAYLRALPPQTTTVTLTLGEVVAILGTPLPASAETSTWWTSTRRTLQAATWHAAGWRVARVAFRVAAPAITFARLAPDGIP